MSRLFIKLLADLGPKHCELYWLAGFERDKNNNWFLRAGMRDMASGLFHVRRLPIGLLPLMVLGKIFADGELLDLSIRGTFGSAIISDVGRFEEITSADIPPALYSFAGKENGVQRLFRYQTGQGELLIPTIELIRYLFVHNRTLANALMRPGALNLLYYPLAPGYQHELILRFTAELPKHCLSPSFAQEFAWIAIDPDARRAWDSVNMQSFGQQYVTFRPPILKNSMCRFRGVQIGNLWLVLEILHMSGKRQPCDILKYGHPSMQEVIRKTPGAALGQNREADGDNGDAAPEHILYDYELDDGEDGAKSGERDTMDTHSKLSDFDRTITVEKFLIAANKPTAATRKVSSTTTISAPVERHQTIKVTAGERTLNAKLPSLDFETLVQAPREWMGDLQAMAMTVEQMAHQLPQARFAMSLCQLKAGRAFSMANRTPRVALVVTIHPLDSPPIVLVDIERTGHVTLSVVALRFKHPMSFRDLEVSIKRLLDGLVDAGGHWDNSVENDLLAVCDCERMPKMFSPRERVAQKGQTTLWALKLLRKLGLIRDD